MIWSLVIGHWSLVTGHWSHITRHTSLVTRHSSLVTRHTSLSLSLTAKTIVQNFLSDVRTSHASWRHLLWKDFMQASPVLIATAIGVPMIQLILAGVATISKPQVADDLCATTMILGIASIFIACIGIIGYVVGHERQVGTWMWSSSLPISWWRALTSKIAVTLACSLLLTVLVSVVPSVLHYAGYTNVSESERIPPQEIGFLAMLFLFSMTLTIAYFVFTNLVFREPLVAIAWAIFGLALLQACLINFRSPFPIVLELFIGVGLMLWTFRWRWQTGQFTTLSLSRNISFAPTNGLSKWFQPTTPPLIRLATLNAMWLVGLMVPFGFVVSSLRLSPDNPEIQIFPAIFALFVGVTTFAGDQALGRFRFLADRGVSPSQLVTSRLCVTSLVTTLLTLMVVSVSWVSHLRANVPFPWSHAAVGAIGVLIAFLLGAFASLCFKKPVTELAVALIFLMATGALYSSVPQIQSSFFPRLDATWILTLCVYVAPVSCTLMVVAIYRLARKWIVEDKPILGHYFLFVSAVAILFPITVAVITAFCIDPL
ncbi:MAG: hypothetical protein ABL921_09565 [Pirellula sp.]